MAENPFQYTRSVNGDEFVGRRWLVHALLDEVRRGTSVLLVGATCSGRTSLLVRLMHGLKGELRDESLGEAKFIPLYVDASTLEVEAGAEEFWRYALRCHPTLRGLLNENEEFRFTPEAIEELFARLKQRRVRPVLLINHVEALRTRPNLWTLGFLGRLRARAVRGQVAIIGTSELSARRINGTLPSDWQGPGFNHMLEYVLGPVQREDTDELLSRAGERFSAEDREFIVKSSACQIYLTQVLAGCMWVFNAYGISSAENRAKAARSGLQIVDATFDLHWQSWSLGDRTLVFTVALNELGVQPSLRGELAEAGPANRLDGSTARDLACLLRECCSEAEVRVLMARLHLENCLPGRAATADEVFAEAALSVLRRGFEEPLIQELARERPGKHLRIQKVAHSLGIRHVAVPIGEGLVTVPDYDNLVRTGILERSTLRLSSPMLLWWIVDRMRSLALRHVTAELWFKSMALDGNASSLKRALVEAIDRVRERVILGSEPFIAEAAKTETHAHPQEPMKPAIMAWAVAEETEGTAETFDGLVSCALKL